MLKDNNIGAVILAAGHGTRMKSDLPKVMHLLNGKPLVEHVWQNVFDSDCFTKIVIVVSPNNNLVRDHLGDKADYAVQTEQLGTAHAVMSAENILKEQVKTVAVFYGDMPFLRPESIRKLVETHCSLNNQVTIMTFTVPDFSGENSLFANFGRIIRDVNGKIVKSVERKDANEEELKITELNPCFYCFNASWLWENLKRIKNDNNQKEYYLTDLIKLALSSEAKISSISIDPKEALGINTKEDLEIVSQKL